MAPLHAGRRALTLDPASRWPLWVAALAALGSYPLISFTYYSALLNTGTLPTNADSIGILIYSDTVLAVGLALPVLAVTALCIRTGTIGALWGWRRDRPIASILISAPFGAFAVAGVAVIVISMFQLSFWFDLLWSLHAGLCVWWALLARAAAINQLRQTT